MYIFQFNIKSHSLYINKMDKWQLTGNNTIVMNFDNLSKSNTQNSLILIRSKGTRKMPTRKPESAMRKTTGWSTKYSQTYHSTPNKKPLISIEINIRNNTRLSPHNQSIWTLQWKKYAHIVTELCNW